MSEKINDQSFSKDNNMSTRIRPLPTNTSSDSDTPDKFLEKMKHTMSKKKNNYKNIPELNNIYDKVAIGSLSGETTAKNHMRKDDISNDMALNPEIKSLSEKLDKKTSESLKNMNNSIYDTGVIPTLRTMRGTSTSRYNSSGIRSFSGEHLEELDQEFHRMKEHFGSISDDRIYTPEYEFDPSDSSQSYKDLINNVKNGTVDMGDVDKLLHTGEITQSQYNSIFGWFLNDKGSDWKNIEPPTIDTKNCGPDKKDCGPDAKNMYEYIRYAIDSFKYILRGYSWVLKYFATVLYKSVDGIIDGNPSNQLSDVDIIANILHFLIMIPVSWYYAYNWFYITFYENIPNSATPDEYRKNVFNLLNNVPYVIPINQPTLLLHTWVIQTQLVYIWNSMFDIFKFLGLSPITNFFKNPMTILICMTVFILFMNCNYSGYIMKLLISFMEDTDFPFQKYLYGIVFFDVFIGISPVSFIERILNIFKTYFNPLSVLFKFIITIIISVLLIRLSGIIAILHSYFMSVFALLVFHADNNPQKAIFEMKKAIFTTIEPCSSETGVSKPVAKILKFIIDNLLPILSTCVLLYSMFLIFTQMASNSGKIILSQIFGFLILISASWVVYNYRMSKTELDTSKLFFPDNIKNPFNK